MVKVAKWSYKVFPHDANYNERTDKENDFFDFDSDQYLQVEALYNECRNGTK